jgi:hypothetical protein
VIRGHPCQAPTATCGSSDAPHARAVRFLSMVIVVAGCGHGPERTLLASLIAAPDAVFDAVSCIIGWHFLVVARGHLPAH